MVGVLSWCTEQWIVLPSPLVRLLPSPAGSSSKVRFADTEPRAWLNPLIPSRSFLNWPDGESEQQFSRAKPASKPRVALGLGLMSQTTQKKGPG